MAITETRPGLDTKRGDPKPVNPLKVVETDLYASILSLDNKGLRNRILQRVTARLEKITKDTGNDLNKAYPFINLLYGPTFSDLPAAAKRQEMYLIADGKETQGLLPRSIFDQYTYLVQAAHAEGNPNARTYQRSIRLLNEEISDGGGLEMLFPYIGSRSMIDLPVNHDEGDTTFLDLEPKVMEQNTSVQTAMARGIGVLEEQETWNEYIRRDDIVVINHQLVTSQLEAWAHRHPEAIIGHTRTQYDDNWELQKVFKGFPARFTMVRTKYKDVRADVIFKAAKEAQLEDLGDLLKENRATLSMKLHIPTEWLFI